MYVSSPSCTMTSRPSGSPPAAHVMRAFLITGCTSYHSLPQRLRHAVRMSALDMLKCLLKCLLKCSLFSWTSLGHFPTGGTSLRSLCKFVWAHWLAGRKSL